MAHCPGRKAESFSKGTDVVDNHFDCHTGWLSQQNLQSKGMRAEG